MGAVAAARPETDPNSWNADFTIPYGLMTPGQGFALMARQHMHKYGTTSEQFGAVAVSTRFHASRNPNALYRDPITLEDHQNSRMISDPLHLFDYCLETDGATALLVTSPERARDLTQKPAYVMAGAMGGAGRFGMGIFWHQMPDDYYSSSGHRSLRRAFITWLGSAHKTSTSPRCTTTSPRW